VKSTLGKLWCYWRTGYTTYLSVPISASGVLASVYYLAVQRSPALLALFPTFGSFVLVGVIGCTVLGCVIGWIHYTWSKAFSSEVRVLIENNPYMYQTTPGKERDVQWPVVLLLLDELEMLARSESRRLEIRELSNKVRVLIEGGKV
jgi:hypothetical protein